MEWQGTIPDVAEWGGGGVGADEERTGNKRKSDYQMCKSLTDMFL